MRCETTSSVKECALRAPSTHGVHHAIVEVNIVTGVVLGEVLVARVVPLVVDAVVGLTLGLIAHVVIVVFVVAISNRIFLYARYTLYNMRTHLAVTSKKNQHEEKKMRDIQVSKTESETTSEEHTDKWRNTVRFEQEAQNASVSSDPLVALEYTARGETQDRSGSVLVQKSGHVDDDLQISALDAFYEKDGRRSRHIGEVLERYRGEDLRSGHVSTLPGGKFGKLIRRF